MNEAKVLFSTMPDLSANDEPEAAAREAYAYVRELSAKMGQDPDIETSIFAPGEREESDGSWWVIWESGPYDWAIEVSLDGRRRTYAENWYCETYWGFDLIFVDERSN